MPTTLGVQNHRSSRGKDSQIYLPKGYKTIPELFNQQGYQTFNMGKEDYNFNYQHNEMFSLDPITEGLKKFRTNSRGVVQKGAIFKLSELDKTKPFFGQIQLEGGKDKGKAITKIAPQSIVNKIPPYYPTHPSFLKAWARHYEQIAITDMRVGKILAELKENDLLENTAIFFFTDHGMVLPRHKQFLYEGGLRVPFIVSWLNNNGHLRSNGAIRDDIINGIDIGTTSLGLAGINIPDYMEGDDLFSKHYQEKEFTIAARDRLDYTFDRIRAVRSKHYKYIKNYFSERAYMQAQYRDLHPERFPFMTAYKELYQQGKLTPAQALFMAPTRPEEELYDLVSDPHEINNLAADAAYKNQLIKHRTILKEWIKKSGDKGQELESDVGVADVIKRWGKNCVNVECVNYRKKHSS
jgi:N-sulfoglucosamine sulfohydrolase